MNFTKILFVIAVFAFNFNIAKSQLSEILLPQQKMKVVDFSNNNSEWEQFNEMHKNWTAIIDPVTNTPHRAFGKPIKIKGFSEINKSNIEEASMKFLTKNQKYFNINVSELRFLNARKAKNKWYVSFVQNSNGYDVLLSEIELRITKDARVMALGIDFYNDIEIDDKTKISFDKAFMAATGTNNSKKNKFSLLSKNNNEIFILPYISGDAIHYRLVYEIPFKDNSSNKNYLAYVDANNGEIVWRMNRTFNFNSEIVTSGLIKEKYANDEFSEKPLHNLYINIDDEQYLTDENGKIQIEINDKTSFSSNLEGPYCKFITPNKIAFEDTILPEEPYKLLWNDKKATKWERNLFYHVNYARDWITGIDTNLKVMDYQLVLDLQENSDYSFGYHPNGYSTMDGDTIGYVAFMNDSLLLCESPTVFYHEYAHATNIKMYKSMGQERGMINMATHEAIADISSAFMINDPIVGRGVFPNEPDRFIRTCDNNNIYPDSIVGESHHDGQILSGAIWDLSEVLGQEYVIDLMHFSRYGVPDDVNTGIAYSEWFLEFLITDDDDGDLSNGTPNIIEIIKAFNKHKIGTNLLYAFQFEHEKLDDIDDKNSDLTMNFKLGKISIPESNIENLKMHYTIDNWETSYEVSCEALDSVNYFATMPALGKSGVLKYKFTGYDEFSDDTLSFPSLEYPEYEILYGYYTNEYEDFEEAENWIIGAEDDDAEFGQFEIGKPELVSLDGSAQFTIQPEGDYSEEGDKCLVTDKRTASFFDMATKSLSKGKTTALSPVYDLSVIETPIIKYHYWYKFMAFTSPPEDAVPPRIDFEATTDGGESWILLSRHLQPESKWKLNMIYLPDSVASHTEVQFKITAINTFDDGLMVEALFDEFKVLSPTDVILGIKKNNIVKIQENISAFPNPFHNAITIDCYFKIADYREIAVYNEMGNKIKSLYNGTCPSGKKEVLWDGTDDNQNPVNSGVYFIKVNDSNESFIINIVKL